MLRKTNLFLAVMTVFVLSARSQKPAATDYYPSIARYDLSRLWCSDSVFNQDDEENFTFPEPLGFIGSNYQRFYIHYTSVKKNPQNPYEYIVTGKTRVKNVILSFKGSITVKRARLYRTSDNPKYKEGRLYAGVRLNEDSAAAGSGSFLGMVTTDFCIDKKGRIYYNTINSAGDGFSNNQCITTWKSYRTGATKKCNWGDFRIPESEALDHGAGEFTVDEKYIHSGWESYVRSYRNGGDSTAIAEEDRKWWKD